ncbi:hypothetical protein F5Y16DRAFT_419187 [Xylariaceae sp. FL0255]|nr:hypothetical protein F5Y16DRAFT_419187 [Xylariaceae sp. FL0255]
MSQVHAMSSIYNGAKFVIIEASGNGIKDGISGITSSSLDAVGPTTWNSRGWTYQEAILPKRKVFFTESQVFYECALRIDHEEMLTYSSFDPSMHSKHHYPTSTTSLVYNAASECASELRKTELSNTRENPWEAYARHLPRYRQRKLREPADLLSAFLGILDALYPGNQSYYGLPIPDFYLALMWRFWDDPYIRKVPLTGAPENHSGDRRLFPSWSWASAADVIVDYDSLKYFCGTLCQWFKPDSTGKQLVPIIAPSQAASRWIKRDGFWDIDPGTGTDALHKLWVTILAIGLLENPVCAEAKEWSLRSTRDVTDQLAARWPSYAAFWQDIYGQEVALRYLQSRLVEETHDRIRDGVIVTQARIRYIEIRRSRRSAYQEAKRQKFEIFGERSHSIGFIHNDCSQRIENLLNEDTGVFDCIAMSISTTNAQNRESSVSGSDDQESDDENTPHTDGSIADGIKNRTSPIFWGSSIDSPWKLEPWVNVLVIHKQEGYCYRIGLGRINIDDWLESSGKLETIVLA